MLLYQNIPSSHFPAQLPSNFFAVRPRRCLPMWNERFCATVRTHFECTCEFALVHPTQTATPAELTTHTHRHTHTHLKKSTKIKRKQTLKGGKCEGKRWWHRHNNAHNCRHASLLRGRGRAVCVCVCVRERGWEYKEQRSERLHRHFHSSRLAYTCIRVCVCVRERERGRIEFVAVCALRFTFNFSADSVFDFVSWCGFPHPLSHSLALTTLARSLSPSLWHSLWCALSRGGFCGEFNSSWTLTVH